MSLEIMTSVDLNENSVSNIPDDIHTVGGKRMHVLDSELSSTSENPVQNKAIKFALDNLNQKIDNINVEIDDATIKRNGSNALFGIGAGYYVNGVLKGEVFNYNGGTTTNVASGDRSHAEGRDNTAAGDFSHVEGMNNKALTTYSHAEGYATEASGFGGHAEGEYAQAIGTFSHAEGAQTAALGHYSHIEGGSSNDYRPAKYGTTKDEILAAWNDKNTRGFALTLDSYNHAEGWNCLALEEYCHAEGQQTRADGTAAHSEGRRTNAINHSAHAEGEDTTASGQVSHAEGLWTTASGNISHAEGNNATASGTNSHAEGADTVAFGSDAHAEGHHTTAAVAAHSEGHYTTASGSSSHAEGQNTSATNTNSHAEGQSSNIYDPETHGTTEEGIYSSWLNLNRKFAVSSGLRTHSEGMDCIALRLSAHAEGTETCAKGSHSHSEGFQTTAYGQVSHAEGRYSVAFGQGSHAEGYTESSPPSTFPTDTKASLIAAFKESSFSLAYGEGSHIEGYNTFAYGTNAHAEGYETCVIGGYSHVEGKNNEIYGESSHGEGVTNNIASEASASHIEGSSNVISEGSAVHAEGMMNTVSGDCAHVSGFCNQIQGIAAYVSGSLNANTVSGYGSTIMGQRNIVNTYSIAIGTNLVAGDLQCAIGTANAHGMVMATDFKMVYKTYPSDNEKSLVYTQNYAIIKKDSQDNTVSLVMCVAGFDSSLSASDIKHVLVNGTLVNSQYCSLSYLSGITGQPALTNLNQYYLIIDANGFTIDPDGEYTIEATFNGSLGDKNIFVVGNGTYAEDEDCDNLHRANALAIDYQGTAKVQNDIIFKFKDSNNVKHRISAQKIVTALLSLGINISDLENVAPE